MPDTDPSASTLARMSQIEGRVRELFSSRIEWPEPALQLNLRARGGVRAREVRHIHQMCSGHASGFKSQNQVKVGYLCRGFVHAVESDNPLSIFNAARSSLEFHAWSHYVSKKLTEAASSRPEQWQSAGESFFDALIRAKYGSSDRGKLAALEDARDEFEFKPIQVMTCLDHLSKREGFDWAREHYEALCDYVHPNLGSQTVAVTRIRGGTFVQQRAGGTLIHSSDAIQSYEYPSPKWSRFATNYTCARAALSAEDLWALYEQLPMSPYSAAFLEEATGRADGITFVGPGELPGSRSSAPLAVGRNERCPCGSGQKYKRCHGR